MPSFRAATQIVKMFGNPLTSQSAFGQTPQVQTNPMKDIEVSSPPDDTVSALEFSPMAITQNFLLAGSWDSSVRLWEVEQTGKTVPKQMQTMGGAVLDVCWADVRQKSFPTIHVSSKNN